MFPFVNPVSGFECVVPPVVAKKLGIDEYDTPVEVAYLHVAASFVARLIVAEVVPAVNCPEGKPLERTGAVVSPPPTEKLFVPLAGSRPWLFAASFAVA